WHGSGVSVMEMSHRGKEFMSIYAATLAALRTLLAVPDNYKILFLQGGAIGFTAIPPQREWQLDPGAAYVHICSNETIIGLEYHWTPETGDVPLVADMSSDILSRPLDISRYGLIYAGAQKNIGPAGLTIVLVRDDLLGGALPTTPTAFDYTVQAANDSM